MIMTGSKATLTINGKVVTALGAGMVSQSMNWSRVGSADPDPSVGRWGEIGEHTMTISDQLDYENEDVIVKFKRSWNSAHYGPYSGGMSGRPHTVTYVLRVKIGENYIPQAE